MVVIKCKEDERISSIIYSLMDFLLLVVNFEEFFNDDENIVDEVRLFF